MKNYSKWLILTGILVIALVFLGFFLIKSDSFKNLGPVRSREGSERASTSNGIEINSIQYVKIAGKKLKVDLVLTPEAQERGLSGRIGLGEDEGMLFVFDHPDKYSFWMKDMNFPIDIVWLGEDLKVIYLKKNASPESYPQTFTPNGEARYVLEVSPLFSEKNNLKEGDKVEFLSS